MDISLMTISIFGELFFKYQIDRDFDGLEETYEEMLDLVKDCGYRKLDVTALETQVFGVDAVLAKLTERGLQAGSYIYLAELARHDEEGFAQRIADVKTAADTAARFGTDILMLAPQAHEGIEPSTTGGYLLKPILAKSSLPDITFTNILCDPWTAEMCSVLSHSCSSPFSYSKKI